MFDLFWSNSWVLPFECVFFVEGKIKYRPKMHSAVGPSQPTIKAYIFFGFN